MTAAVANIVSKYQGVAPERIIRAVEKASVKTGVDFEFLMNKASTESSFNPTAKAKTSSATGLFQFIENTWLTMVKEYGDKYGLKQYADKIKLNDEGKACVTDGSLKREILNLRKNPEISALMAGEFSAQNKEILETKTSADVGATELYLAHFMGPNGAAKFLNCRKNNGDAKACNVLPEAARANKNVFFDRATGRARTLDEVYSLFAKKFSGGESATPPHGEEIATPFKGRTFSPPSGSAPTPSGRLAFGSAPAPVTVPPYLDPLETTAQALPSSEIIWKDDPRYARKFARIDMAAATGFQKLSPASMLTVMEMQHGETNSERRVKSRAAQGTYNS